MWAVVSDYAADTIWRKGIAEMTPDADGPPRVGTHVREVLVLGGRTYTTETAVTDVGPGLTYGFSGTGTSGEVRGRRTVVAAGTPQSARFSYDVELEPTAVAAHPRAADGALAGAQHATRSAPPAPARSRTQA